MRGFPDALGVIEENQMMETGRMKWFCLFFGERKRGIRKIGQTDVCLVCEEGIWHTIGLFIRCMTDMCLVCEEGI